ncbi:DsbA family protein [Candidatus Parcubacteria bacterium]|nr:DsbA family protein [Candidatus Parcubacteria bacterium]
MKKILFLLLIFVLFGAGCAEGEPQATIKNPQIGDDSAPVEIVEYFDYQCTACKLSEASIIPFLIEDYVGNGEVKVIYKNFAFMGEVSRLASNAALCAEEQGKFYEFHTKIFEAQGTEGASAYDSKSLKRIARELGLDGAQFDSCLDSNKYEDQILSEINEARVNNVNSTPTYVINGEKVSGAGSYLSVKRIVDRKLMDLGVVQK